MYRERKTLIYEFVIQFKEPTQKTSLISPESVRSAVKTAYSNTLLEI